jgi:hypothetical protein
MTARSTWKGWERRCAKLLGGRRRPVTGIDRHDGDVYSARFEVQCKCRGRQPAYLLEWLKGICATATARGRIGLVVWKQAGRGHDDADALVVLRWQDFVTIVESMDSEISLRKENLAADGAPRQPTQNGSAGSVSLVSNGSPNRETQETRSNVEQVQPTFW